MMNWIFGLLVGAVVWLFLSRNEASNDVKGLTKEVDELHDAIDKLQNEVDSLRDDVDYLRGEVEEKSDYKDDDYELT